MPGVLSVRTSDRSGGRARSEEISGAIVELHAKTLGLFTKEQAEWLWRVSRYLKFRRNHIRERGCNLLHLQLPLRIATALCHI